MFFCGKERYRKGKSHRVKVIIYVTTTQICEVKGFQLRLRRFLACYYRHAGNKTLLLSLLATRVVARIESSSSRVVVVANDVIEKYSIARASGRQRITLVGM